MNAWVLTSRQRLIDFLDLKNLNSTDNTVLDLVIESATDYVEHYCDRRFKKTSYTNELYDGTDSPYLVLREFPVVSGETFTLQRRDSSRNEDDWSTIDTEEYFVNNDTGEIEYSAGFIFVNYPKHYRVTYTAGYSFDISAGTYLSTLGMGDLEMAVWKLCARAWHKRRGDPDVGRERLLNYDVTYVRMTEEDPEVRKVLDKYAKIDIL